MGPGDTAPHPPGPLPSAPVAETPPWRRPAPAAQPAAQTEPALASDETIGAEDSRWTWVEAAAEAWLANRLDKPSQDDTKDAPS